MVTAVKRPAGETRGKVAAGPTTGQCHRASPRPYIGLLLPSGAARSSALKAGLRRQRQVADTMPTSARGGLRHGDHPGGRWRG
jgi:hypothetical protein